MNLQIRDPRAREMARKLAKAQDCTMTEAVVDALDHRLRQIDSRDSLRVTAERIRNRLKEKAKLGGKDVPKAEIDTLWGHDPA
jgi:antitoxin VapB